jgi:hypothetical protein
MPKTTNWPTLALDKKKTMIVEVADETCAEPWAEWAEQ